MLYRDLPAMVSCLEANQCDKNNVGMYVIWLTLIGATDGYTYVCSSTEKRQGKSSFTEFLTGGVYSVWWRSQEYKLYWGKKRGTRIEKPKASGGVNVRECPLPGRQGSLGRVVIRKLPQRAQRAEPGRK